MVTVTSATSSASTASTTSSSAAATASLDYNAFLKLLVAQMQNQDPTDPQDSTEWVSQLASFSSVEQAIQTNTYLESLLQSASLSDADAIIGRTVTSEDGTVTGVVESVTLSSDGVTATLDTGKTLAITEGVKISATET